MCHAEIAYCRATAVQRAQEFRLEEWQELTGQRNVPAGFDLSLPSTVPVSLDISPEGKVSTIPAPTITLGVNVISRREAKVEAQIAAGRQEIAKDAAMQANYHMQKDIQNQIKTEVRKACQECIRYARSGGVNVEALVHLCVTRTSGLLSGYAQSALKELQELFFSEGGRLKKRDNDTDIIGMIVKIGNDFETNIRLTDRYIELDTVLAVINEARDSRYAVRPSQEPSEFQKKVRAHPFNKDIIEVRRLCSENKLGEAQNVVNRYQETADRTKLKSDRANLEDINNLFKGLERLIRCRAFAGKQKATKASIEQTQKSAVERAINDGFIYNARARVGDTSHTQAYRSLAQAVERALTDPKVDRTILKCHHIAKHAALSDNGVDFVSRVVSSLQNGRLSEQERYELQEVLMSTDVLCQAALEGKKTLSDEIWQALKPLLNVSGKASDFEGAKIINSISYAQVIVQQAKNVSRLERILQSAEIDFEVRLLETLANKTQCYDLLDKWQKEIEQSDISAIAKYEQIARLEIARKLVSYEMTIGSFIQNPRQCSIELIKNSFTLAQLVSQTFVDLSTVPTYVLFGGQTPQFTLVRQLIANVDAFVRDTPANQLKAVVGLGMDLAVQALLTKAAIGIARAGLTIEGKSITPALQTELMAEAKANNLDKLFPMQGPITPQAANAVKTVLVAQAQAEIDALVAGTRQKFSLVKDAGNTTSLGKCKNSQIIYGNGWRKTALDWRQFDRTFTDG